MRLKVHHQENLIKTLMFLGLAFFPHLIFASDISYDVRMKLSIGGRPSGEPRIIVQEGKKASVTQDAGNHKKFIEVVITENRDKKDGKLVMKFVVGSIDKDGNRTVLAEPQAIAKENEEAKLAVSTKSGQEIISLAVKAQRKKL